MDPECPLCGCEILPPARITCEDCQSDHVVCQTCAEQVASAGYRFVTRASKVD